MNDTIFRILAAVIFISGVAISSYHRIKAERLSDEKISLREEGLWMTIALRISGVALLLTVLAYLLNPSWVTWARLDLPDWLRWLGVGMGVAADGLSYWVFSNLGKNVTPTVVTRKEASLVTSGPYRYVRHPLYSMGMLSYLGFALLAENWFVVLMAIVGFTLISIRLRKEEANLIARFGDEYRQYMQRTGRFLPRMG